MDSLEMQRTSVKQEDSTEDSDIEFIGASSQPLSSRPTASASTAPKVSPPTNSSSSLDNDPEVSAFAVGRIYKDFEAFNERLTEWHAAKYPGRALCRRTKGYRARMPSISCNQTPRCSFKVRLLLLHGSSKCKIHSSVVQHSDHCHTKRQSCSSGTQAPTQRANGPSLAKGRPPSSSHPRGLSSLDVGAVYKGSQEDLVTNLKDWHNREYPHQVLYIRARHASQLVVVCKEKRMHMHCEFLVAFKAMDDGSGFRVTQSNLEHSQICKSHRYQLENQLSRASGRRLLKQGAGESHTPTSKTRCSRKAWKDDESDSEASLEESESTTEDEDDDEFGGDSDDDDQEEDVDDGNKDGNDDGDGNENIEENSDEQETIGDRKTQAGSRSKYTPTKRATARDRGQLAVTLPPVLAEYFAHFGIAAYGDFTRVGIDSRKAFMKSVECPPKGFSKGDANAVRLAAHLALEMIAKKLNWK